LLSRARLALLCAALVALTAALMPTIAAAATTIPDSAIPDPSLRTWVKTQLKVPTGEEIPLETAETATKLTGGSIQAPIADLTGLEDFPNLATLNLPAYSKEPSTFSSLAPLVALPKLTSLSLAGAGGLTDIGQLAGVSQLTTISIEGSPVTDLSPLAGSAANLTSVSFRSGKLSDLSTLPNLPALKNLGLTNDQIVDVSPLVSKLDPTKLNQIGLQSNRITDPSPLVPLGVGSLPLGNYASVNSTLLLAGNRIADFSAFRVWNKPLPSNSSEKEQTVYVGNYRPGGITVPIKSSSPTVTLTPAAGEPATFDQETGLLTLNGTTPIERVQFAKVAALTSWTVVFTAAPEATDPTAPQITGSLAIGGLLTASTGSWIEGLTCASTEYQWYRDGVAIAKVPYLDGIQRPAPASQPTIGDGGTFSSYVVQPQDAGHRLSVKVFCGGTPAYNTSAPTEVVEIDSAAPLTPTIQPLEGRLVLGSTYAVEQPRSYVLGDPTPTRIPFYVGALDADKNLISPESLTVTVDPGTGTSLAPGDYSVEGTGAVRTLVLKASAVGTQSNIAIHVATPTGQSKTMTLSLKVAAAATPTSTYLWGDTDSSTAIDVGGGYLLVADDEVSDIKLYDARTTGREKASFRVDPNEGSEIDYEASARKGDTIYWLGSHGNDSGGAPSPGRSRLFASTVSGTGASTTLAPKGAGYQGLRVDLIAWDREHGDRLGFFAGTQTGVNPELIRGFDIEGAEFSPDDSELYLGFRAPLSPAEVGGKAVIVPVKNVEALITAPTGEDTRKAEFDEPILLDLEGQSIREIRKNAAGEYLIISGEVGTLTPNAEHQILWAWDGERGHQPVKLATQLPADIGPLHQSGFWETIAEMPAKLTAGEPLGLIMDQGDDELYVAKAPNKKDFDYWSRRSRHDFVTIAPPVTTRFAVTDFGAFPDQATNTIGAPRTITVTNDGITGLNRVSLTRAKVVGSDSLSRSDFIVSLDDCSGETLEKGESCDISVRFAPSRTNTTSDAELEISGNIPGGTTTIPLTGTSTELPKGEAGEDGKDGADGEDGQAGPQGDDGAAGPAGPQGADGVDGKDGADGQTGPKGADGTNGVNGVDGQPGPQGVGGPKGDVGPAGAKGEKGDRGPAGHDGTFAFTASQDATTRARRGRTVTLSFSVHNGTTARAKSLGLKARAPKALHASGLRTSGLGTLAAGDSRTIHLSFRIGRTAKLGIHKVRVQLKVEGRTVTRTVTVQVAR
jgi:hypothetical protein